MIGRLGVAHASPAGHLVVAGSAGGVECIVDTLGRVGTVECEAIPIAAVRPAICELDLISLEHVTNRLRRGVGVEVASDDDIVLPGRIGGGQVGEESGELLGLFGLNSAFEADTEVSGAKPNLL